MFSFYPDTFFLQVAGQVDFLVSWVDFLGARQSLSYHPCGEGPVREAQPVSTLKVLRQATVALAGRLCGMR
jgi:hypothetical protein